MWPDLPGERDGEESLNGSPAHTLTNGYSFFSSARSAIFIVPEARSMTSSGGATCFSRLDNRPRSIFRSYGASEIYWQLEAINISSLRDWSREILLKR